MRKISMRDAKAALAEVVAEAQLGHLSVITKRGRRAAVVIGFEEWQLLTAVPSFGRLLASAPLDDGDLLQRDKDVARPLPF